MVSTRGHVIICGWSDTARQVLDELFAANESEDVVLVNRLPEDLVQELMQSYRDKHILYVRGDFINEEILNKANVQYARSVILVPDSSQGVAPRSDEKTILAAFTIKAMNPKIRLYAHIVDSDSIPYLKKAHVDDYVVSDTHVGLMLGQMVTSPGVPQSLKMLMTSHADKMLRTIPVPPHLVGKTFRDAHEELRTTGQLPIAIVLERKPISLKNILSEDVSYLDDFIEKKFTAAGKKLQKEHRVDVQLNPPDDTELTANLNLLVLSGGDV